MYERKVDKILGQYNFDPVQVFLVEKKGKVFLRYQYYAFGEITKDISFEEAVITNPEESLAIIAEGKTPFEFSIQGCNPELHFKFTKIEENRLFKGMMVAKVMGFIPVSWISASVKRSSLVAFLESIMKLAHNKAPQPTPKSGAAEL